MALVARFNHSPGISLHLLMKFMMGTWNGEVKHYCLLGDFRMQ